MQILSTTNTTLEQCLTWAKNKKATDLFISIVPILYNTAVKEGVNPLLVVAQCAKETGYCRFGGVLDASYKNTCGLKIPQGGSCTDPNAHMRFDSWEEGALAQVEHLALYAGKEGYPLDNPKDPRHFDYLFGTCKTVHELSGKWAGGTYGEDLIKLIREIEQTPAENKADEKDKEIEELKNKIKEYESDKEILKKKITEILELIS